MNKKVKSKKITKKVLTKKQKRSIKKDKRLLDAPEKKQAKKIKRVTKKPTSDVNAKKAKFNEAVEGVIGMHRVARKSLISNTTSVAEH